LPESLETAWVEVDQFTARVDAEQHALVLAAVGIV
jgi:hypothetical protein